MGTLFIYVVVIAAVGAALFVVAGAVFGRSEEVEPLAKGVTPTVLPAEEMRGDDVRAVRFRLRLRGYDQQDVDWALERVAERLDELNERVADLESRLATPPGAARQSGRIERIVPPSTPVFDGPASVSDGSAEETVAPPPAVEDHDRSSGADSAELATGVERSEQVGRPRR